MTAAVTEIEVDTSDLDALDDDTHHYYCTICYPKRVLGMLVITCCGVERLMPLRAGLGKALCPGCKEAMGKACPRCGWSPS